MSLCKFLANGEYVCIDKNQKENFRDNCGIDPVQPPASYTLTGESGGNGGSPFSYRCPDNTYVTDFYLKSGSLVYQIGGQCSNGSRFGPFGGGSGSSYQVRSPDGFNRADLRTGKFVDRIALYNAQGQMVGAYGGAGGNPTTKSCNEKRITGVIGRRGDYVDNLGFFCG